MTGRKRSKIDVKLNCAMKASNNRAAISADARPMLYADVRCAAAPQNATPNTAVPPDDTISATAF